MPKDNDQHVKFKSKNVATNDLQFSKTLFKSIQPSQLLRSNFVSLLNNLYERHNKYKERHGYGWKYTSK